MRRKTIHPCLASICLGLLLSVVACGDATSLDTLFSKRKGASNEETANQPSDDEGDEGKKKPDVPSVWPEAVIVNEDDFKYGIPEGELVIKFQAENLDGFELKCRAAPVADIREAKKESCEDSFEIDDYENNRDYRFELYAVHEASGSERMILASDFRTDPILIVIPEELALKTQYSGIGYITLQATTPLPAYYTCSSVSDLVWDPTFDCRNGTLRLEFTRFNGSVRMRIMAWSLNTNKLLSERDLFFCSGYFCARNIGPTSPPPYE